MVVLSQPVTLANHVSLNPKFKPEPVIIPVVNLTEPDAKTQIVKACEDFGFFKVVNHEVRPDLLTNLDQQAISFFGLPQSLKDQTGPPDPFGYGSKQIGPNGDIGWIEYILLNANPHVPSLNTTAIFRQTPAIFREIIEEYMEEIKKLTSNVLEKIAEGLDLDTKNKLSKVVNDKKSDSCLRLNHYPATGKNQENVLGFGEHTDPQLISILRSNKTDGFQICVKDGSWVSVQPDQSSFFVLVGDCLQVMTNGRFKSVKHRVLTDTRKSRMSMIYFAGPPLKEKVTPLKCLVPKQEDWVYEEFTWSEYKLSAYKTKLGDHRLGLFEKKSTVSKSYI